MELSTTLLKIFNTIFPFGDFLYIFQQEEYSPRRYIKWLPRFFWRRNFQMRDRLKYTPRVIITLIFIWCLWLASLVLVLTSISCAVLWIVTMAAWIIFIPIFVLLGNIIMAPYFAYAKIRVINAAARKIKAQKDIRIVVVGGSFGKTTTKNFIHQLTRYNYATQMVSGNINTAVGIALWVKTNLRPNTELLIVEMDTYRAGEIAQSSFITPADIAIITNIGDQHLERFGDVKNLTRALSEIFLHAKPNAKLLCNRETAEVITPLIPDREITVVDQEASAVIPDGLSASARTDFTFALKAAEMLDIPERIMVDVSKKLELPDRRQKITELYGYEAIDDSYNISFTTAKAGIVSAREYANEKRKKLLVVTAGIPEVGPAEEHGNEELGTLLAASADHVIILGSIFTHEIVAGIVDQKKCTIVPNLNDFLNDAKKKFPPNEWVLFLQPELTDLYY